MPKPEWEFNTPVKFWELSLQEQMVYTAAYGSEFQHGYNKGDHAEVLARNALYSFWRRHGNPRFNITRDQVNLAEDDWGR